MGGKIKGNFQKIPLKKQNPAFAGFRLGHKTLRVIWLIGNLFKKTKSNLRWILFGPSKT
jgi:hypothetical protein